MPAIEYKIHVKKNMRKVQELFFKKIVREKSIFWILLCYFLVILFSLFFEPGRLYSFLFVPRNILTHIVGGFGITSVWVSSFSKRWILGCLVVVNTFSLCSSYKMDRRNSPYLKRQFERDSLFCHRNGCPSILWVSFWEETASREVQESVVQSGEAAVLSQFS